MAVLEKATNHYYKINFDRCAVRGLKVYVNYNIYDSLQERDKEKDREAHWAVFFQKLRENIENRHRDIMLALEEKNLTPEEVLSENEEDKIDGVNFPELIAMQEDMNLLETLEKEIGERLFVFIDKEQQELVIPDHLMIVLISLGFQNEWISSPILLKGGGEVYCGKYNNEKITYELFYGRLKGVMGDTEDC